MFSGCLFSRSRQSKISCAARWLVPVSAASSRISCSSLLRCSWLGCGAPTRRHRRRSDRHRARPARGTRPDSRVARQLGMEVFASAGGDRQPTTPPPPTMSWSIVVLCGPFGPSGLLVTYLAIGRTEARHPANRLHFTTGLVGWRPRVPDGRHPQGIPSGSPVAGKPRPALGPGRLCPISTSTCRNLATISSTVYRFLGSPQSSMAKSHTSGRTTSQEAGQIPSCR